MKKIILLSALALSVSTITQAQQNTSYDIDAIPLTNANQFSTAFGYQSLFINNGDGNSATGYNSMWQNFTGKYNTSNGFQSMYLSYEGSYNVANGAEALRSNNMGSFNSINGARAMFNNISGNNNVANGYEALFSITSTNNNVANGYQALYNNKGSGNVANGFQALYSSTSGLSNTANGNSCMRNASGDGNSANGALAMFYSTGSRNVANGLQALYNNSGVENVANGYQAMLNNGSGSRNAANGGSALRSNSAGNDNTASGHSSLFSNKGDRNTASGAQALYSNTNGIENTASGFGALRANTTGSYNTANGVNALYGNTGNWNTASGHNALYSNQGNYNVAIGYLSQFWTSNGSQNTSVGTGSMEFNTWGSRNSALGFQALYQSIGDNNVGIGAEALAFNNSGHENVAVGNEALKNNNIGAYNTAIGYQSLESDKGNFWNTAVGYQALRTNGVLGGAAPATANTAVGAGAMYQNNIGNYNTAIGTSSLADNTFGDENSAIGYQSGIGVPGSYRNTYLGAFTTTSTGGFNDATAIGANAIVNNSNRVWVGSASDDVWGGSSFFIVSDERFKSSVEEDDVKGLEFIKLLRPVVYNFDSKKLTEHVTSGMADSISEHYLNRDFSKSTQVRQNGFIAQEVEEAAKQANYDFDGVHTPENDHDTYGVSYSTFVVPLVKAVQEQQKIIEDQKAESLLQIQDLQKQIEELKNLVAAGSTNGNNGTNLISSDFNMGQNDPNPFTDETVIDFTLPITVGSSSLYIYDLSGKQLNSFSIYERGASSITITSQELSPGIYIYALVADGTIIDSKRMIIAD